LRFWPPFNVLPRPIQYLILTLGKQALQIDVAGSLAMTSDQKSGKGKSSKATRGHRRISLPAANASVRAQRSKRSYKAPTNVNALRDSEARFRELADNISQFAWTADQAGWIYWYNKRWYDYTGTTLEEMQGWGWQKVHHPEHVERVVRRIRESFETGKAWEDTFPLRGRDGTYRWFLSRALPIRNEAGDIVRWFGTNTDLSEQIEAENALRDSEARFRELADNISQFAWTAD
jgi:PAS domain S-box-containing protein